jgi:hypothetical protein
MDGLTLVSRGFQVMDSLYRGSTSQRTALEPETQRTGRQGGK